MKQEGTTTPLDMTVIDRVPRLQNLAAHMQSCATS